MNLVECQNEVRIIIVGMISIEILNFRNLAIRPVGYPVQPTDRTIPKPKRERLLVLAGNPPKQGRLTIPELEVRSI